MSDISGIPAADIVVLQALMAAADEAKPCPTADDILWILGHAGFEYISVASTVNILQRLEARGLIEVERWQRSRRVKIVATGQYTADPENKTPHWRLDPPKGVPTPSPAEIRAREPAIAEQIFRRASQEGLSSSEYLSRLVWIGWQQMEAVNG
jgi:hypothetical protein